MGVEYFGWFLLDLIAIPLGLIAFLVMAWYATMDGKLTTGAFSQIPTRTMAVTREACKRHESGDDIGMRLSLIAHFFCGGLGFRLILWSLHKMFA